MVFSLRPSTGAVRVEWTLTSSDGGAVADPGTLVVKDGCVATYMAPSSVAQSFTVNIAAYPVVARATGSSSESGPVASEVTLTQVFVR